MSIDDQLTCLSDVSGSRFLHKPTSGSSSPLKLTCSTIHVTLNNNNTYANTNSSYQHYTLEWKTTSGSVNRHRLPMENVSQVCSGFPAELREHANFFSSHHHRLAFHLRTTRGKYLVLAAPNVRKLNQWVNVLQHSLSAAPNTNTTTHKLARRTTPAAALADMGKQLLKSVVVDPLTRAATNGDRYTIENFVNERRQHRSFRSIDQSSIETALFFAAAGGHANCVEPLLRISASFYRHHDGNTVMHAAIKSNNSHVVRLVAQYNFNLTDEVDGQGNTPVHLAVERGDLECLTVLLQTAAETNQPNRQGHTPLAVARQRRSRLKKIRSGLTAVELGSRRDNDAVQRIRTANDVVKLLKEYGGSMTPKTSAVGGGGGGEGETDMVRIMTIWNTFFENAMKWRMGQETGGQETGGQGGETKGGEEDYRQYEFVPPSSSSYPQHQHRQHQQHQHQQQHQHHHQQQQQQQQLLKHKGGNMIFNSWSHQPSVPALPSQTPRQAWSTQDTNVGGTTAAVSGWQQHRDEWYASHPSTATESGHDGYQQAPSSSSTSSSSSSSSSSNYTVRRRLIVQVDTA